MKFFISGQINDIAHVRAAIHDVEAAGHEVTHDWTQTDTFLGGAEDKLANKRESGVRAEKDIQGVLDCDVYVLVSDNEAVGKGMYVELGAALAAHQLRNSPKVYVIGPRNHLSVFYLHPIVVHMDTIEDVIADLEG